MVRVPDELALELGDLDELVVQPADHLGRPVFSDARELRLDVHE